MQKIVIQREIYMRIKKEEVKLKAAAQKNTESRRKIIKTNWK